MRQPKAEIAARPNGWFFKAAQTNLVIGAFAFFVFAGLFRVSAMAAPGDLDPAFGNGGIVLTNVLPGREAGSAIAVQSDGKIVVAGTASEFPFGTENFAVVRYNTDGSLDNTFGTNGVVVTDFATSSGTVGIAIQPDGKIVVAGTVLGPNATDDFGIIRYMPDGMLDLTFGNGGKVTTDFFGDFDGADSVAVQPDGRILVAGLAKMVGVPSDFAVVRYETNGDLDAAFGNGGKATVDFFGAADICRTMALHPNGSIVLAGFAFQGGGVPADFAVAILDPSGSPDPTFGVQGKVTTDFFGSNDEASAVAVQADGKIVVAGRANDVGMGSDFGIVRFAPDGSLDGSFGVGGKTTTDFFGMGESANAMAIQPDGKIVAVGLISMGGTDLDFGVARYKTDGSLDNSFGIGGKVTTPLTDSDAALAVALQDDCKIVAAGFSNPHNTSDSMLGVVRYDAGSCGSTPPCPLGHGFWKNDPGAWPVDSLTLGGKSYSKEELLKLLKDSTSTDASIILARQLIAAKLNIENGSDPTPAEAPIQDADALLSGYNGKLPLKIKPATSTGQTMVQHAAVLDSYNNGLLTPNCPL